MLFCTQPFLFFFIVVFAAYWSLPWPRARVYLLLAASIYFYSCWNHWLAALICLTTAVDYVLARALEATQVRWRAKALLGLSLGMNLGLLVYFKYANFFLRSLEDGLRAAGVTASLPVLSVILPVGISFYTFEVISYTVDVYRRRIPAEKNLANFLLFITFFPHLVAGPIVRARDFLPQAGRPHRWSWFRFHLGGGYILLGMVKKMVIADRMALYADPVFAYPTLCSTASLWVGVLAYAMQLYCDFSGYSDLALGTAHLLGYKLSPNFKMPYLSANVSEFWRRWHISLSTWIRDYLFIPLGGSRQGRWRTYRNLLITMTLAGLWHGASWNFVVFGLLHGVCLAAHRMFEEIFDERSFVRRLLATGPGTVLRVVVTFLVCTGIWVIFRSPTLAQGMTVLRGLVVPQEGSALPYPTACVAWLGIAMLACHLLAAGGGWKVAWRRVPAPVRGLGYAAVVLLCLLLVPVTTQMFIYFQF